MSSKEQKICMDAYYAGRARHFLDKVLVPLIKREVQNPSSDVSGSPAIAYTVIAIRGAQAEMSKTNQFLMN